MLETLNRKNKADGFSHKQKLILKEEGFDLKSAKWLSAENGYNAFKPETAYREAEAVLLREIESPKTRRNLPPIGVYVMDSPTPRVIIPIDPARKSYAQSIPVVISKKLLSNEVGLNAEETAAVVHTMVSEYITALEPAPLPDLNHLKAPAGGAASVAALAYILGKAADESSQDLVNRRDVARMTMGGLLGAATGAFINATSNDTPQAAAKEAPPLPIDINAEALASAAEKINRWKRQHPETKQIAKK